MLLLVYLVHGEKLNRKYCSRTISGDVPIPRDNVLSGTQFTVPDELSTFLKCSAMCDAGVMAVSWAVSLSPCVKSGAQSPPILFKNILFPDRISLKYSFFVGIFTVSGLGKVGRLNNANATTPTFLALFPGTWSSLLSNLALFPARTLL